MDLSAAGIDDCSLWRGWYTKCDECSLGRNQRRHTDLHLCQRRTTTKNILSRKAFTVSMAEASYVKECDYVGIVSGNDVPDKFQKVGFHAEPSEFVDAPMIKELHMALECKLVSYDPETCRLVGEIINVSADESIIGEDGKIDPERLQPIIFDPVHNKYRVIGEVAGNAFRDGLALK